MLFIVGHAAHLRRQPGAQSLRAAVGRLADSRCGVGFLGWSGGPDSCSLLSPKMQRLVAAAALIALALAWFADFALLFLPLPDGASAPSTAATSWLPVFVTGPLATLALPDYRWQLPLTRRVELVAGVSIALSCACLLVPQRGAGAGALETLALLLLIIRVVAEVRPTRTAPWRLALLVVAVLMLTVRARTMETFLTGTYVLTMVMAVCVILGAALRLQEALRRRDVQEVRQAERLALARDLHDLVAHHMTGIIVQANAGRTVQATAPEKVGPIPSGASSRAFRSRPGRSTPGPNGGPPTRSPAPPASGACGRTKASADHPALRRSQLAGGTLQSNPPCTAQRDS